MTLSKFAGGFMTHFFLVPWDWSLHALPRASGAPLEGAAT
jgi:hypothetical protein